MNLKTKIALGSLAFLVVVVIIFVILAYTDVFNILTYMGITSEEEKTEEAPVQLEEIEEAEEPTPAPRPVSGRSGTGIQQMITPPAGRRYGVYEGARKIIANGKEYRTGISPSDYKRGVISLHDYDGNLLDIVDVKDNILETDIGEDEKMKGVLPYPSDMTPIEMGEDPDKYRKYGCFNYNKDDPMLAYNLKVNGELTTFDECRDISKRAYGGYRTYFGRRNCTADGLGECWGGPTGTKFNKYGLCKDDTCGTSGMVIYGAPSRYST